MNINVEQLGAQTGLLIGVFGSVAAAWIKWKVPLTRMFGGNGKSKPVCSMHSGIESAINSLASLQEMHYKKADDFYKDQKEQMTRIHERIDEILIHGRRRS